MADDTYVVQLVLTANNQLSASVNGVTRDLGGMDTKMKQTAQTGGALENSFRRLQQAMELGIAGALLQKVGNMASEMYELGESSRIAAITFENLSGGSAQANTMLTMLRETTGEVINDLNLMQSASKYMSMGLGENSEEINRLIELAVKLGGAMGHDAASSIEDFSLLLANESVLRLDTFGISSAKVRQRMEELQASGEALNRSDAFRMAVLEQGAVSLDRLGDAATASITPLARFQTTMENLWAQASQNFATGANATIGLIDGVASAAARSSPEVQRADDEAFARGVVVAQRFLDGYQTALTDQNVRDITAAAFEKLRNDPGFDLASPEAIPQLIPNYMMMTDEQWQQADFLLRFIAEQNTELEHAAQLTLQAADAEELRARLAERTRDIYRQVTTFISESAAQRRIEEQVRGLIDSADMAAQLMAGVANPTGRGAIGGVTLITDAELAQIEQLGRQYEQALDAAKELHDQDLLSDEQLQYIQSGADEMERMRDAARDGAEALRNLSLSQVFGEGGQTTLAGDLSKSFLDAARELDLGDSGYQQLADTIMLSTGQITDASVTYRDEVIPLLLQVAQQLSPEDAAAALANLQTYLRDAAMQGLTPQQTAAGMVRATGYGFTGGGGTEFTVNAGDTPTSVAARYGLSVDQIMAGAGITNSRSLLPGTYGAGGGGVAAINTSGYFSSPYASATVWENLPNAVDTAVDPFKQIEDSASKAATSLDDITASLEELNGKEVAVKINFDTSALPDWLMKLLELGVRDNGGQVPGATERGRSRVEAR